MDALVPRPAVPHLPAPLLPADVVAGLRGAAGLPDLEPRAPVGAPADVAEDPNVGDAGEDTDVAVGLVAVVDDAPPTTGGPAAGAVDAGDAKAGDAAAGDAAAGGTRVRDDGEVSPVVATGAATVAAAPRAPTSTSLTDAGAPDAAGNAGDRGNAGHVAASVVVDDGRTAVPVAVSVAASVAAPVAAPVDAGAPADAGVLHSGAGLGLGGAGPRPVEVVDGGDGAVIVAALPSSSSSSPSPSSSPSVVTRPTASAPGFEFPDDTTTWRAFLDKVRAVRAGARAKARVVQLGDSEIAGDRFVSTLRNDMAAQIGLGGPGFALASPPWHWYRRAGFESLDSSGFRGHSFVFARGNEGNFGPGGVAFDAVAADARVDAKLEARFAGAGCTIEFFFAAQPGGGAIELFVDDASTGVVELAGDAAVSSWRHTATSCPRRLSARVRRLPARVFGWSIESAQNGVVWTSLGTVGANASALSRYGPGRLGQALSLLQPDLVVASYGLNLTGHGAPVPRSEGEQLQRLMAEIRAVRPDTACLVMSPYPVLVDTDGALAPSGTTRRLANVQRKAAQAAGCVFLDRERLVGGPDVALQWLNRKPRYLSGDYVHLTPEGASYVSRTVSRLLIGEIFGG